MIKFIRGEDRDAYPAYMYQIHRIRAQAFKERRGWDVDVKGGLEADCYDDANPLYIVCHNEDQVLGSCRELPYAGLNMLNNTFQVLLGPDGPLQDEGYWEQSRFSVSDKAKDILSNGLKRASIELLLGAQYAAMYYGKIGILSVIDVLMVRFLKRAGVIFTQIGDEVVIGKTRTIAGMFPVNKEAVESISRTNGLSFDDILPFR